MFKGHEFIEKDRNVLVFRRTRFLAFYNFIFFSLILLIWYGSLFTQIKLEDYHPLYFLLLFLGPLGVLPVLRAAMKTVHTRDAIIFDPNVQIIHDGNRQIPFREVDYLQIRAVSIGDGEGSPSLEYQLSIVFKSGKNMQIEQLVNHSEICDISERIAFILKKRIKE